MKDGSNDSNRTPIAGGDRAENQPSNANTDEERKPVVEHLTHALDAEELTQKEFHIREALQFLNLEER